MEEAFVRLSQTNPGVVFPAPEFKRSPMFIMRFRKHHALALRRPHFKRRPSVTPDQIAGFYSMMEEAIERVPPERLINVDETHWKLVAASRFIPPGKSTNHPHGARMELSSPKTMTMITFRLFPLEI
jgi:hypothetical protein